ncbi:MAG: class I SAM-dependent methyltransferase [Candidatus Binatia bacterium]
MAESIGTRTGGDGSSYVVERCQICDSVNLEPILFLGYLPPVNLMPVIGEPPREQSAYPAQLLRCLRCQLVQLGLVVDPQILFPPEYPYTSGTTKILRDNFAKLYRECQELIGLGSNDLVVDIGSNDGTLLSNFKNGAHQVQGVEPARVGNLANEKGIPTLISFFNTEVATVIRAKHGTAKIVTATNVFAHMDNIHEILDAIISLLGHDGVFISESHYLMSLVETLQYDTIYHEHLRYYSFSSLEYLLEMHGLSVFHAKRIPTHGGSIRVYAARPGAYETRESVAVIRQEEGRTELNSVRLSEFKNKVVMSKLDLYTLLFDIKKRGQRIFGIGAPSRASTLINYVGIDDGILDCVLEIRGSHKIGKYIPGTLIPVIEESLLFEKQPEYALLLSWHIAEELAPKLSQKGFKGDFIVPLPTAHIVLNNEIPLVGAE